jgi:hypothetical protein
MTGWLEYGSSSPFSRFRQRQFFLLHDLTGCFAFRDRWADAEAVLQATIAWCERCMHPCHPLALVTLLDLSAVFEKLGKPEDAKSTVSLFRRRSSMYLSELEARSYQRLSDQAVDNWSAEPSFRIEIGPGPAEDLESFCWYLQYLLNRRIVSVLGKEHPIVAYHHMLLGDAFSVAANCLAPAAAMHAGLSSPSQGFDAAYWRLALAHYTRVFRNLDASAMNESLYSTSYGLARCLHELGHSKRALSLLLTVLSDPADGPQLSGHCHDIIEKTSSSFADVKHADGDDSVTFRFLAGVGTPGDCDAGRTLTSLPGLWVAQASCYWLAAILSVESAQESAMEGWSRALACLRSASHLYQRALRCFPEGEDGISRAACLSQLRTVEEEARRLISLRKGDYVNPLRLASSS